MILVASKGGALANRLWVFAHFVATAADMGTTVAVVSFDDYADSFVGPARDVLCRFPGRVSRVRPTARRRRLVYQAVRAVGALLARTWPRGRCWTLLRLDWEERLDLGDPATRTLLQRPVVLAQGWLYRDEDALLRHADVVRRFLAPRSDVLAAAQAAVGPLRTRCGVVVGVHVRRGDYAGFRDGRYFYDVAQYRALMVHLAALLGGSSPGFLVTSDEPVDAATLDVGAPVAVAKGSAVEDLYALAECDYIIGPPSTFSLWASFAGSVPAYLIEDPARLPALDDFELMSAGFRNGEPTARTVTAYAASGGDAG